MNPYYTGELRYLDKAFTANERENYSNWFDEQIKMFGQTVDYFTINYQLSAHDPVYGEQPNATYSTSKQIIMMIELSESSIMLGKFGLESEDELTAFVTISSFKGAFGDREPLAGDVFTLSEYGEGRPGGRGGKSFEITERLDQDIEKLNPLMSHFAWQLKARRLDFTFQPGLTAEKKMDQITDSDFSGRKSGGNNPQTEPKIDTTNDIDTASKQIFDYSDIDEADDIYGDYY